MKLQKQRPVWENFKMKNDRGKVPNMRCRVEVQQLDQFAQEKEF